MQRRRRRLSSQLIGVALLFSGAALLAHIITGLSLRFALALSTSALCATVWIVWTRASRTGRLILKRMAVAGFIAGIAATAAYNLSGDQRLAAIGNGPLIVDGVDGSVHPTGSTRPLERYFERYERQRSRTNG